MNEVLSHRLFRDAGVPAARTAYAKVYVTVPGKHDRQYLGLYSLVEDVRQDCSRTSASAAAGGPSSSPSRRTLRRPWRRLGEVQPDLRPQDQLSEPQKRRVIEFARLVTQADDAEFAAKLGDYVDLDNFSRFMAVTVWLSTMDSSGRPELLRLPAPADEQVPFMPWDLDHSSASSSRSCRRRPSSSGTSCIRGPIRSRGRRPRWLTN